MLRPVLAILLIIQIMAGFGSGYVLCIGLDGHRAIETRSVIHCADGLPGEDSIGRCHDSCTDIALISPSIISSRQTTQIDSTPWTVNGQFFANGNVQSQINPFSNGATARSAQAVDRLRTIILVV